MNKFASCSVKKILSSLLVLMGFGSLWAAKKGNVSAVPVMVDDDVVAAEGFMDLDMMEISQDGESSFYTIGQDSQSWTSEREVIPFSINRYETDYRLWFYVRMWAEDNGYFFIYPGQEGSKGKRGKFPSEQNMYQPVTMISWYDAVVWCNAFSEMTGHEPCYVYEGLVIRDAWDTAALDQIVCRWSCDGYRLPSETEWELAARKTCSGLQRGNLASGQVNAQGKSDGSVSVTDIGWISDNSKETHCVGTAGTPFKTNAPPSPGSGNTNGAGIFDMTGNVLEFCWDWYGNYMDQKEGAFPSGPESGAMRVMRGGSWSPYSLFCNAGDRYAYDPNEAYNYMGFRIAQTVVKPIDSDFDVEEEDDSDEPEMLTEISTDSSAEEESN